LGILLNLEELYRLLPETYRGGFQVVLLIGGVRLFDAFLGINTAILYNSRYYTALLAMGVLLSVLTVLLNMWLIPEMGILGAAVATFLAVTLYNVLKLVFVRWKFGLSPFSPGTLKILLLSILTYLLFFWVEFPFHPLVNIALKSLLIALFYGGVVYRLRISEDLNAFGRNFFKK
jgi:O-antigen/teichoic acid export membrane protein